MKKIMVIEKPCTKSIFEKNKIYDMGTKDEFIEQWRSEIDISTIDITEYYFIKTHTKHQGMKYDVDIFKIKKKYCKVMEYDNKGYIN